MKKYFYSFLVCCLLWAAGAARVAAGSFPLASEGAWCWFADPRAIHYENEAGTINASYVGYIDVHGNIKAMQFDFLTGERNEVLVRSNFQPDDHNNPTFLVLPDERVLVIYSRHTDEPAFYYRVSRKPGDITSLGEEKCIRTSHNTTYPSPFILSDDPEHFYLCWRGIGWHPTIAKFSLPDGNDDVEVEWGPYQMVQSTGARPYAKYSSNGKDKIYVTYTTGHPDNEMPNYVYFNVIDLQAEKDAVGNVTTNPVLEDVRGNRLSVIADGAFKVDKTQGYRDSYPYTVVDAPGDRRDWVWQVASDADGHPVIAMVRISGGKDQHEYFYAKWTGDAWRLTDLADGGGRFHSSNIEYCYSGGMALDPADVKTVYLSIPTEGAHGRVYELWKYVLDDEGKVVAKEQVTKDSEKNNVRPYVLPDSEGTDLRLTWMNGDYEYWIVKKDFPNGYPTDIYSEYDYQAKIGEDVDAPASDKDFGGQAMDAGTQETVALPGGGAFTLNVVLGIGEEAYHGKLLAGGNWEYSVSQESVKPCLTVDGEAYGSQNVLYTSDNWALNSTGTSGDNWPTCLGTFNLTLAYDGETLTVYRNGWIDQRVEGLRLDGDEVKIGGYKGTLERATAYSRCLSQDEVKQMLRQQVLDALYVPDEIRTDVVLPVKLNGEKVSWASDHADVLDAGGTFAAPDAETEVRLTATVGELSRSFTLRAMPRDIRENLIAAYAFETEDVYEDGGARKVKDLSGNGRDLSLMGKAEADGVLDLTGNQPTAFTSNGYALLPSDVLDSLRSYTVLFTATPASLAAAPRFYDFGFNAGNSLFFRANTLAAGIKYNGGITTMVNGGYTLEAGRTYKLAVTYDARSGVTSIYVDGKLVGSGTANVNEPYMIPALQTPERNYVGRTQWWDSNVAADNADYVGTLDDFEMYDVALELDEIMERQEIRAEDETLNVDCSGFLKNRDFEGEYSVKGGTGVTSDRAVYEPEGWNVTYTDGNENDMTILNATCLYASLFSGIPTTNGGGENAYLVRQKWGVSSIGLEQACDSLPAAYYRLGAEVWQGGSGGSAVLYGSTRGGKEVSATMADLAGWQQGEVMFPHDGSVSVVVGMKAVHTENGGEKFVGFDNVVLYDVTANRNPAELAGLLEDMEAFAGRLLEGTLPDENMRETLEEACGKAALLDGNDTQEELYAAYGALRDALSASQVPHATGVRPVTLAEGDGKAGAVYDLGGRLVRKTADFRKGWDDLQPGVYIQGNRKVWVR